jgi:hypothetical protein
MTELDQVRYVGPTRQVSNLSCPVDMKTINSGDIGYIVQLHTPTVFDVAFSNPDGTTRVWTVLEAEELEMVKPSRTH